MFLNWLFFFHNNYFIKTFTIITYSKKFPRTFLTKTTTPYATFQHSDHLFFPANDPHHDCVVVVGHTWATPSPDVLSDRHFPTETWESTPYSRESRSVTYVFPTLFSRWGVCQLLEVPFPPARLSQIVYFLMNTRAGFCNFAQKCPIKSGATGYARVRDF